MSGIPYMIVESMGILKREKSLAVSPPAAGRKDVIKYAEAKIRRNVT